MHFDSETQVSLIKKWKNGDNSALDLLVRSNKNMVYKLAYQSMKVSGIELEDLVQEGYIGILKAAEKFDPDNGAAFSTYATIWVKQRLMKYSMQNRSMVVVGKTRDSRSLFVGFGKTWASISSKKMTKEEKFAYVATKLNVKYDSVVKYYNMIIGGDQSIDQQISEDGASFLDKMVDPEGSDSKIENDYENKEFLERVHSVTQDLFENELNEKEREIFKLRHMEEEPVSYSEIARMLGCSRTNVSAIEKRVLDIIRHRVSSIYNK